MAAEDIPTLISFSQLHDQEVQFAYLKDITIPAATGTILFDTGFKEVLCVQMTLEEDPIETAGKILSCSKSTQSSEPGTITLKAWKDSDADAAPAAASSDIDVDVLIIGVAWDN